MAKSKNAVAEKAAETEINETGAETAAEQPEAEAAAAAEPAAIEPAGKTTLKDAVGESISEHESDIAAAEKMRDDQAEPVLHLDTGVVEEPARDRFSDVVSRAARDARVAGDAHKHAALHQFEIAIGEFKRAAAVAAKHFDKGSRERGFVDHLSDL